MLGVFPTPARSESLYSVFARHTAAMRIRGRRAAREDLFGSSRGTAVVDLPNRLDALLAMFPARAPFAADVLAERHTGLPYYAPFAPLERVERVMVAMRASGGAAPHNLLGLRASVVRQPAFLAFCPACVEADRRGRLRVAYWHREHQLPGVLVCPTHGARLHDAHAAPRHRRQDRLAFVPLEEALKAGSAARALPPDALAHALWLAEQTAWLVEHGASYAGRDSGRSADWYRARCAMLGFGRGRRQLRVSELRAAVGSHFGSALLEACGCPVPAVESSTSGGDDWLSRIVRRPRVAAHPLLHLLMCRFLRVSVATLLEEIEDLPALVVRVRAVDDRQPLAASTCGTASSCAAPGSAGCDVPAGNCEAQTGGVALARRTGCHQDAGEPEVRPARERVLQPQEVRVGAKGEVHTDEGDGGPGAVAFPSRRAPGVRLGDPGPEWDRHLTALVLDPDVPLQAIAQRLGTTTRTVQRRALRLGVWRDTWQKGRAGAEPTGRAERARSIRQARYRAEWRRLVGWARTCGCGAGELRRRAPAAYGWLYRNDRAWLRAETPVATRRPRRERVDWPARDAALAARVPETAAELLRRGGRPVRVTRLALGRALGASEMIGCHAVRLPSTVAAIATATESAEAFASRRLQWAADLYGAERRVPRWWQLVRRAALGRAPLATWEAEASAHVSRLQRLLLGPSMPTT